MTKNQDLPPEIAATIPMRLHEAHAALKSGRPEEARDTCTGILLIDPLNCAAHELLGLAADALGDTTRALRHFRIALTHDANNCSLVYNYATVLQKVGEHLQAVEYYRKALELSPTHYAAANNYCALLCMMGAMDEAEHRARDIVKNQPDSTIARVNLGNILKDAGKIPEAVATYREALQIDPGSALAWSSLLLCLNYLPAYEAGEIDILHRRFEESIRTHPARDLRKQRQSPKLRVGYLSADFRMHSVAFFIEPILRNHSPEQFEVFCYYDNPSVDEVTKRLMALPCTWRTIAGMTDNAVRTLLLDDRLDILVDLAGHTGANRLPLFLDRIATVHVTYLGYPNTTGISTMDVRLTDPYADPVGEDRHYSEKLIRLPQGFLCYQPPASAPAPSPPPALSRGLVTFGSFNTLPKINTGLIGLWARILRDTDNSRLCLKSKSFVCEGVKKRMRDSFAEQGIEPTRIDLLPTDPLLTAHLQSYSGIDIALDTFPYNGTTTTCEALWMGVPVVTLAGANHRSRVGGSLLSRIGLTGMIAHSEEEYTDIAGFLASDIQRLAGLRAGLRSAVARSPLCDGPAFTRELESVLRGLVAARTPPC